jgi:hypothetical protein
MIMQDKLLYAELLEQIGSIPVIDTHEHLESEEYRVNRYVDMFNTYMIHYASCDLISSGMNDDDMEFLKSDSPDIDKKWAIFRPYWEKSRNTTYCKSLVYATRDIYGIEDINDSTYKLIDHEIKLSNKKGLYKYILKDLCHIETSILDSDVNCDRDFFVSTANLDDYIRFKSKDTITKAEKQFNISIGNLSDWVDLIRKRIEEYKTKYGVACIKSPLAYERILRFDRTDYSAAENIFNNILSTKEYSGWYSFSPADFPTKPLEDFLMHSVVRTASEMDLPIQFHTGLQEGNGNIITNSNPVNLVNLFMEYPKARFDIFHAGYPYGGELCAIAKNFRNVYVDLCWSHIISREYTVRFLEEALDTIPANKIFGFGGDYCFVEGVYGHLKIARENIALALANKVSKGYFTMQEALEIAHRLLYDNAKEFFKL